MLSRCVALWYVFNNDVSSTMVFLLYESMNLSAMFGSVQEIGVKSCSNQYSGMSLVISESEAELEAD